MSKVFIGVGHGGSDPGAVGVVKEKDANLNMAFACKEYLEANGVNVLMSRYEDIDESLNEKINECNQYDPDYALDIHNNAGGGDGFEIFHSVIGGKGKELAEKIELEIVGMGQNSRGVKTKVNSSGKDYFGFIRQTNAPAVICEGFFVDNQTDAKIGDTVEEQRKFGVAYAKGILNQLGIQEKTLEANQENQYGYDREQVIKNLQHAYNVSYGIGLAEDGIKGPKTEETMKTYPIRNYKENELARWIQDRLVNHKGYLLTIDGKYGSQTEATVRQFQRDNRLIVDGIAGFNTITILI